MAARELIQARGQTPPSSAWSCAAAKRSFDRSVAAVALTVLAPLLLLIAFLIRLDSPGPAVYRQVRHGLDESVFTILKFRTLHIVSCDSPAGPFMQVTGDDARVTRLGRLLRRTSLDELPQFINVLRGEMSIVGPRPHPVALSANYARLIGSYRRRHQVRPGITGLAQIKGARGEIDTLEKMARRVDFDVEYIDNWSFGLDLRIIGRSLFFGFLQTKAK